MRFFMVCRDVSFYHLYFFAGSPLEFFHIIGIIKSHLYFLDSCTNYSAVFCKRCGNTYPFPETDNQTIFLSATGKSFFGFVLFAFFLLLLYTTFDHPRPKDLYQSHLLGFSLACWTDTKFCLWR